MQAMKCDLCGKLYECYDGINVDAGGYSIKEVNSISLIHCNPDNTGQHSFRRDELLKTFKVYDLCPDCLNAITATIYERMSIKK